MRKRLPLCLVIVLLLAGLPTAALSRRRLSVLCTAQEDYCRAMTRAFQAETGILTSYVNMTSGEALGRLHADFRYPDFSVWWGGSAEALHSNSCGVT